MNPNPEIFHCLDSDLDKKKAHKLPSSLFREREKISLKSKQIFSLYSFLKIKIQNTVVTSFSKSCQVGKLNILKVNFLCTDHFPNPDPKVGSNGNPGSIFGMKGNIKRATWG